MLTAVLSLSAFADGDLPGGGKSCQSGCLADSGTEIKVSEKSPIDETVEFVKDFLKKIFG